MIDHNVQFVGLVWGIPMIWFEPLPGGCPPPDATEPNNDIFFRLTKAYPPSESDFWSQRKLYPNKPFHTSECRAMSLSIYSDLEACLLIRKLNPHKEKKIIQITLPSESGVLKQTGKDPNHYSWWRKHGFDPITNCMEVPLNGAHPQ